MSRPCTTPLSFETLVAYWAGDLPQPASDAVDAHVIGCERCATASEGIAVITEGIRASISPFITAGELAALRARGLRIDENPVRPGLRAPALFRGDVDLLIHRLGELDLSRAERVQVRVLSEKTGEVMMESPAVPFEAGTGEVLIACQRHFADWPHDVVFQVSVIEAGVVRTSATYIVPHLFERAR
jgi:anti-sigma factor RsiW